MLGVSAGLMGSSADGGGASGGSSEAGAASSSVPGGGMEESGGGGGGKRWPRQETLALLKIRCDMDVTFRESSLKGPLWEEVSRKMVELGYQRSAKKCKEKFENVYKYHKRTKDGRASKSDAKAYRFFDQLEALENTPPPPPPPPPQHLFNPPPPPRPVEAAAAAIAAAAPPPPMPVPNTNTTGLLITTTTTTVSSTADPNPNPVSVAPPPAQVSTNIPINSSQPPFQPPPLPPPTSAAAAMNTTNHPPPQIHNFQPHLLLPENLLISNSTSTSSTSSDEDIQRRRGRKRKWKDFFESLMKDVIHKQEDLQKKFIDALEKRERNRMAREEAWRVQEIARMNREHELLVHERSIAAAKDAAVIAFLQKVTEQQNSQTPIGNNNNSNNAPSPQAPPQVPMQAPPPPPSPVQAPTLTPPTKPIAAPPVSTVAITSLIKISPDALKTDNGENSMSASSSRWPKAEVEALINLRKNLDLKYQENGPKGPLWEEISSAMAKLGYNRSSKRCKEKWENINKYFKKVKESNKKRPEESKTCPYFQQLDALYKKKAKNDVVASLNPITAIMARPEQQWPLSILQKQPHDDSALMSDHQQNRDNESENNDRQDDDDDEEKEEEEEEEEDEGGGFEIVANKQASSVTNAAD